MGDAVATEGRGGFRVLRMRTLANGADTDGAFELIEDARDTGGGPAPHVHRESDEAFYVLEGRFTFLRDAERVAAGAGSFILVPRGTRHGYEAAVDGSRLLIWYTPAGGFDEFMRELDGLLARGMTSAEAISTLGDRYNTDLA